MARKEINHPFIQTKSQLASSIDITFFKEKSHLLPQLSDWYGSDAAGALQSARVSDVDYTSRATPGPELSADQLVDVHTDDTDDGFPVPLS